MCCNGAHVSDSIHSNSGSDSDEGNVGWANSIAKVLNSSKPQKKKGLVLSRAKKITSSKPKEAEQKQKYDFEVEGEAKDKEETPSVDGSTTEPKKSKNIPLELRTKPTFKDFEKERALKKVATRGVVQLFNAIRTQQKDLVLQMDEAGPLDHKKDAVLNNINKRKFLDVLMKGKRAKSEAVDEDGENSEEEEDDEAVDQRKSEWSVLRDDFMTNKKLKNWDQDESDDDEGGEEDGDDSEDDE